MPPPSGWVFGLTQEGRELEQMRAVTIIHEDVLPTLLMTGSYGHDVSAYQSQNRCNAPLAGSTSLLGACNTNVGEQQ